MKKAWSTSFVADCNSRHMSNMAAENVRMTMGNSRYTVCKDMKSGRVSTHIYCRKYPTHKQFDSGTDHLYDNILRARVA